MSVSLCVGNFFVVCVGSVLYAGCASVLVFVCCFSVCLACGLMLFSVRINVGYRAH